MATLVSSIVEGPQTGSWPQLMTIVQEFDHPVITSDDFKLVFYAKNENPLIQGQMAVAPTQYVPTQLTYTIQVSPFADGELGVLSQIGAIQDIYGNPVDFKIGDDFGIYNTVILPYFPNPTIQYEGWGPDVTVPQTAICPGTTAPQVQLKVGPWSQSMEIPENMWTAGNFYMWVNYAWLPDRESEGIPFVWEPPFYYSFSQFGIPVKETIGPFIPPYPFPTESILNNVISSGTQTGWDTCGEWIEQYPHWRGRVQIWVFGDDVFADGVVPWTYPATVGPDGSGDLSPQAIFGFPADAQQQFFVELPFTYIAPNP